MSGLILPRRFNAQPQHICRIDNQGLGKGIQLLFNPAIGPVDLATKRVWTRGGDLSIVAGRKGKVFNFPGSDGNLSYTGYPDLTGNTGTFFMWCPVVGPQDNFGHVFFYGLGSVLNWFQVAESNKFYAFGQISDQTVSWFNTTNRSLVASSNGTAAGIKAYFEGVNSGLTWSSTPTSWDAGTKNLGIGRYDAGSNWDFSGNILLIGYTSAVWGAAEARAFHENPWALFKASSRKLWPAPEAGAVTGEGAYTNANDTAAASGTTAVTGSVSATNADDTVSASGSPVVAGSLDVSNADDSTSASGSIGSAVSGSADCTNADDTASATGTTTVEGSVSVSNAEDTAAADGTTTVTGSSATTNADDSATASGAIGSAVSGSVAYTNLDDSAAGSGTTTVTGSASVTNANDSSTATGSGVITGEVSVTNAGDTVDAAGSPVVDGTASVTNADDSVDAAGEVEEPEEVIGTVNFTNANDTAAASGTTLILGDLLTINRNDSVTASGIVNDGAVVETVLSSATQNRIKKPGIPHDAPAWLKTTLEILTGRRNNKIEIPKSKTLTFSATPTKEECEALYTHIREVRDSLEQLINRQDS